MQVHGSRSLNSQQINPLNDQKVYAEMCMKVVAINLSSTTWCKWYIARISNKSELLCIK